MLTEMYVAGRPLPCLDIDALVIDDITMRIALTTLLLSTGKSNLHDQVGAALGSVKFPFKTKDDNQKARFLQSVRAPIEAGVPTGGATLNDLPKVPVGARLFRFRRAWQGATHEGLIKKGLGWTWKRRPPRLKRLRQRTSVALDRFIRELKKKRVIERAKRLRLQSRLFTVPKKGSIDGRLILDLSLLNLFINCPSFKMLTLKDTCLLLPAGFWTISIDLLDGYWHVPIAPGKRPFLGFIYRGQAWQFRALPFGLNIAPRAFTKLVSHVVRELA